MDGTGQNSSMTPAVSLVLVISGTPHWRTPPPYHHALVEGFYLGILNYQLMSNYLGSSYLKGHCQEIFDFRFFLESVSPRRLICLLAHQKFRDTVHFSNL